jgi:hypothetical protein
MSLSFLGPRGGVERRWIVYAMLRDNVQHHLEGGAPSSEFANLHAIADALVSGRVTVPALALRSELARLEPLLARSIDDLAVSVRTRAVQSMSLPLPEQPSTELITELDWTLPFPLSGASTLADAFGSLVVELLRITEGAGGSDVVEVVDT